MLRITKLVSRYALLTALFIGGYVVSEGQEPDWLWAVRAGGYGYDRGHDIVVDNNGDIYLTGDFSGTATFGETELVDGGSFVAKLDNEGNWLWVEGAGDCSSRGIAIDHNGNSYVTGTFYQTAVFGETELRSAGYLDIFVAKMDNEGNWLWAQSAGGTERNEGSGIAVDNDGNIYVTGFFAGTATFGETELQSAGRFDIFVAKMDNEGNWLWIREAGGTGENLSYSIVVDNDGYCYLTGYYTEIASFGEIELQSAGRADIFVAKMDNEGNWIWVQSAGGIGTDISRSITLDNNRNIYLTGWYSGTATFGETELRAAAGNDIFVGKLDNEGEWLWAKRAGGAGQFNRGKAIAVDINGNSFVTGSFQRTATFGETQLQAAGRNDIFVAELDSNGNWLRAGRAGGTGRGSMGHGIAIDNNGNYYVTGLFHETATFGEIELQSAGDSNIFVGKIGLHSYPALAVNPRPVDNAVNVSVDLDRLGWDYVSRDGYTNPVGFRVYFNDTGEFGEDDNFAWIPYTAGQTAYECTDLLPETLDFAAKYYWKVVPTTRENGTGEGEDARSVPVWSFTTEGETDIEDSMISCPYITGLEGSYPNPFNPQTAILFSLAEKQSVMIEVFDNRGRKIATLVDDVLSAGRHQIIWDAQDDHGKPVSSGIYLLRMKTSGYTETGSMLLIK